MAPRQPLLCEEPILCKSEPPSRRSARARTRVRARAHEILARFWPQNRPLEGIYYGSFLGSIFGRFLGSKCTKKDVFIVLRSLMCRKYRTKTRFSLDFGLKIDPSRASIMGPF